MRVNMHSGSIIDSKLFTVFKKLTSSRRSHMLNAEKHVWNDLARLLKDYWFEVAMFCLFVAAVFLIGVFIF